jgi:hypothetical protein
MPDNIEDARTNAVTAFSKAFGWVKDTAADVASLDVLTLTGTIALQPGTQGNDSPIDPSAFYQNLTAKVKQDASAVKVVAFTHKDPDNDVVMFVDKDLSEDGKALLEQHREMFKLAEQARQQFVTFVGTIVGVKIT